MDLLILFLYLIKDNVATIDVLVTWPHSGTILGWRVSFSFLLTSMKNKFSNFEICSRIGDLFEYETTKNLVFGSSSSFLKRGLTP